VLVVVQHGPVPLDVGLGAVGKEKLEVWAASPAKNETARTVSRLERRSVFMGGSPGKSF